MFVASKQFFVKKIKVGTHWEEQIIYAPLKK